MLIVQIHNDGAADEAAHYNASVVGTITPRRAPPLATRA